MRIHESDSCSAAAVQSARPTTREHLLPSSTTSAGTLGAADVIVGTSAGALVGALLRLGLPSSDLAAIVVGAPVRHAKPRARTATGQPALRSRR